MIKAATAQRFSSVGCPFFHILRVGLGPFWLTTPIKYPAKSDLTELNSTHHGWTQPMSNSDDNEHEILITDLTSPTPRYLLLLMSRHVRSAKYSEQSTAVIMADEWSVTSELLISYFLDELLILNCQITCYVLKSTLRNWTIAAEKKLNSAARLKIPHALENCGS